MEDKFTEVNGTQIHYRLSGSGASSLLLLHGAVGSINDFSMQLRGELGLSQDQFTLVAVDLPGFGRSQPLKDIKSDPTMEYFEAAADTGARLMSQLGFKTYSVAGWSDGARVAALLAARHQSRVDALALWGFMATMDEESSKALARTRDVHSWDPMVLKQYSSVYGEENFSEMWRHYVDFTLKALELPEEQKFDTRKALNSIKCPTLILHGEQDPIVNYDRHVKPLFYEIYDSQIGRFKSCAHNLHQADPNRFNSELCNFIAGVKA